MRNRDILIVATDWPSMLLLLMDVPSGRMVTIRIGDELLASGSSVDLLMLLSGAMTPAKNSCN